MTTFDELSELLEKLRLVSNEFIDIVRGFLTQEEINKLPKPPDQIDRGAFVEYVQQKGKLDELKAYLHEKYSNRIVQEKRKRRIPFTNRRNEIDEVTTLSSDSLFKYFLIHGPSGYGKTELLYELGDIFEHKGWHHAYADVTKDTSLVNLAEELAHNLKVELESNSALSPGLRLSGSIRLRYGEECKKYKGLVLLIDFDKEPQTELLGKILEEFLPEIESNLRKHICFNNGQMHFRVVLAGRYLAAAKEVKNTSLPLNILPLSPFTYRVIRTTIDEDLSVTTPEEKQKLSAHIVFLTGGHPGCIADIYELFKSHPIPVDEFMRSYTSQIRNMIQKSTESVREGLPEGFENFSSAFDALMVFRQANYFVLDSLRTKYKLDIFRDTFDFEDKLTEGYFFARNQYILQDDIVRRLITTYLRVYHPDNFANYCKQAMEICEAYLLTQDIQSPPQWAIEYLFQWLQIQSIKRIDTITSRNEIRSEFFHNILPRAMELYLKRHSKLTKEKCREDKQAILNELGQLHQWEFEFAVNYYLRVDSCDNSQYESLIQKIKDWLDNKFKEIE